MNRYHVVWLSWLDKNRSNDRPISILELNPIREDLATDAAHSIRRKSVYLFSEVKAGSSGRAQDCGIVPGEFAKRLRELLEPTVVRESTVMDRRISPEDNLEL